MTKKSRQIFKHYENINRNIMRNMIRWNKKHFSSFLKGFQLLKVVLDLRVRLLKYRKANIHDTDIHEADITQEELTLI